MSVSVPRRVALFAWMIASLFYAYQYILRVMPSIMLQDIMQQFRIDAALFGQISGVYYIGYALAHLPIGLMLDRFGPRKVMTSCILLTVLGLTPILFSDKWIYPLIGRILIGIGSSAAILSTFKIIRMTFSEKRFTSMLSLSVTIGLLGAIYGGGPVSQMCQTLDYKTVVAILGAVGIVFAGITYWVVPPTQPQKQESILTDLRTVFSNGKVVFICLLAGLMVGPMEGFADTWGPQFLKRVYHLEDTTASYLPSMIYFGMCFGGPLLSIFAEKTGRYFGAIALAGIVMSLVFTALVMKILTPAGISLSLICVGVACAYQILAIYKASTYVPERVSALTSAVANMIIMSFGYLFNTSIGSIVNAYGGATAASALVYGVTIIPIALVAGTLGFVFLGLKKDSGL